MDPKVIPESRVVRNLESVFSFKTPGVNSIEEFLAKYDQVATQKFPFSLEWVRGTNVEVPVIDGVLRPSPNRGLIKMLTEIPGEPILITDIGRSGPSSLFFAMITTDSDEAERWWSRMTAPCILANQWKGEYIVAAPVSAYAV